MSAKWRIQADTSKSGWAWDVAGLKFLDDDDEVLHPKAAFSSGYGAPGYEPERAVLEDGLWGGRKSEGEGFFLGAEFEEPVLVHRVCFTDTSYDHHAPAEATLQRLEGGAWQTVREVQPEERGRKRPKARDGAASSWRIYAETSQSGWGWDVQKLEFFDEGGNTLRPKAAFSSGCAGQGFAPEKAVLQGGMWGGRKPENSGLFLGAEFDKPMLVHRVHFTDTSPGHHAPLRVTLQRLDGDLWQDVREVYAEERGSRPLRALEAPRPEKAPAPEECVVPPSQPLQGEVHECCLLRELHPPRSEPFVPDGSFYHAENCEGLWVCVSKSCGEETLTRACDMVRAYIPKHLRALWGQFRSPRWAKDPGPMRLVVLDNRINEQAGIVPELQDGSEGRNGTSCPFVFTSREDFYEGVAGGGWRPKRLTTHEMVHGADMVIRQLVDPVVHDQMENFYGRYREKFQHITPIGTTESAYATANRDEFFAEAVSICRGVMDNEDVYVKCGISTKELLQGEMPDLYTFLAKYFSMP